ncbi:hypothetical protein [Sandaracinus amylolyticus]|uniref:Uncharacterized protein n=1 Tax=Sandaracinus amylolyticus TaxID=927083 RepID=A0A0F6WAG0_9BACT|nr:hypothetical protein [Sandaracinus amylolyticus]AKF11556.1 hypothetical protein DB32_008705 [Sandaracinus amylolyticus]
MSDDETLVLVASGVVAAITLWRALVPTMSLSSLHAPTATRRWVWVAFALALVVVHGTLATISASDVRTSVEYTFFYDVMGLAWLGTTVALFHLLGLSLRDDVLERRNPAALAAFAGATIGAGFAFAGGNVGDGPGWWCVVAASGLATILLAGSWLGVHLVGGAADAITIDRDVGSGVRVGALLIAVGAIGGRAAAGDWVSLSHTIETFVVAAWPALVLVVLAGAVERVLARGVPSRSSAVAILAASVYLASAGVVVAAQGLPA